MLVLHYAKLCITSIDMGPGRKISRGIGLYGLPKKWHLLEKARFLSGGTSICQAKL